MPRAFSKRIEQLQSEILKLKEKDNVFLMAHYYQRPEIQAIADVLGDSLGLSRIAQKEAKSDTIIFAGVDFMAETASILNPKKTIFIPDTKATCPMAHMCTAKTLLTIKKQYDLPVVLYVNTLAEAKAHADIMCTSANAERICESLGSDTLIFGPDWNLGWHVSWKTGIELIPVPKHGFCYVHKNFTVEDFQNLKKKHPNAKITVHPECNPEVQKLVFQPFDIESRYCHLFIGTFITSFVEAKNRAVLCDSQSRIGGRTFINQLAYSPGFAFIVAETHGHRNTFRRGWIGEKDSVFGACNLVGVTEHAGITSSDRWLDKGLIPTEIGKCLTAVIAPSQSAAL